MTEGMLTGPEIAPVRTDGRRGRGATANPSGRFERLRKLTFDAQFAYDDGWGGADAAPPRTTITTDASRTIIAHNDSPDVGFDQSINPYRGCEHGCIYCFARPTHAFLGLSPGLDFESRIFASQMPHAFWRANCGGPPGLSWACFLPTKLQISSTCSRWHERSRISSSMSLAHPPPTSTMRRMIVSRCVLVSRSVERIELPSTRQLMI